MIARTEFQTCGPSRQRERERLLRCSTGISWIGTCLWYMGKRPKCCWIRRVELIETGIFATRLESNWNGVETGQKRARFLEAGLTGKFRRTLSSRSGRPYLRHPLGPPNSRNFRKRAAAKWAKCRINQATAAAVLRSDTRRHSPAQIKQPHLIRKLIARRLLASWQPQFWARRSPEKTFTVLSSDRKGLKKKKSWQMSNLIVSTPSWADGSRYIVEVQNRL